MSSCTSFRRCPTGKRFSRLVALLLTGVLGGSLGCGAGSNCDDEVPLAEFEPQGFFETPEVRQENPRRIFVDAVPGELRRVLADAQPGDIIELAPGTHTVRSGGLSLGSSGSADRWIRVGGAEGTRPVIDLLGRTEFRISGSYILLENVEIVNGKGNNLHLAPSGEDVRNIIVRNCKIWRLARGPGAAIKLNRNNPKSAGLERVYIEECDLSEAKKNAVVDGVGVSKVVVRGSFIHDNSQGSSGIFLKGGSSDVLIEGNLIARIRGNSAVKLGGSTGDRFFNPEHPDQEGVKQIARNNLVVDCDDAVFEVRGCRDCRIYNNSVVSQTSFAIFRLQTGRSAGGQPSQNDDIEIVNNLVFATGGNPQFARNDGGPGGFRFRSNLWAGRLHNSSTPGPGIPRFPCRSDVVIREEDVDTVLRDSTYTGVKDLADALRRLQPPAGSPAGGAGSPNRVASKDAAGRPRPSEIPGIGALEPRRTP